MQYMGGKSRISKEIINFINGEREINQTWVEPFMGSCKVLSKAKGPRIGADINQELISLFKMIQQGYEPPQEITEDQYYKIYKNQDNYPDYLKGFVSFACSWGGQRWNGYARSGEKNFAERGFRSLMSMKPLLQNVKFACSDYQNLKIPPNSIIYCDPPYANTTGYGFDFDKSEFLKWCTLKANEGHMVYVSEYESLEGFDLVWSKEVYASMDNVNQNINKKTEKLFRVHKEPSFKLRAY
tara:strand:+ start:3517 stop:4236 length:720 start_codon:yes stop_codon:yes gene_type:complete